MKKYFILLISALALVTLSHHVFADSALTPDPVDYKLLAPIPGIETSPGSGTSNIATYIPNLIKAVIGLATGVAVLMVIYGGAQYIMSGSMNTKKGGKETIQNALLSLVLLSVSWIILYTLNPKLVQFSLKLDNVGSNAPIDTTINTNPNNGNGGSSGGTGSITTGGGNYGAPAGSNNCGSTCVTSNNFSFPAKGPGAACQSTQGSLCLINPALGAKLDSLNTAMIHDGVSWQVTEMVPPTVNHLDTCHANGTCVDATVANPTISNLVKFFSDVKKSGITSYEYEICNQDRLNQLQSDPSFKSLKVKFTCEKTTTSESAHLNL